MHLREHFTVESDYSPDITATSQGDKGNICPDAEDLGTSEPIAHHVEKDLPKSICVDSNAEKSMTSCHKNQKHSDQINLVEEEKDTESEKSAKIQAL